jgi:hypothetical protein
VLAIRELGQSVSDYTPNSQQDAFRLRQRVAALIDSEMISATKGYKDEYYKEMSQTRLTMIQYLNNAAIALPPVETYTFRSNLPSLLCR